MFGVIHKVYEDRFLEGLVKLDVKYLDSDLKEKDVRLHHKQNGVNPIWYFTMDDTLKGYVEFKVSTSERYIHLIWFVAPGYGKRFLQLTLDSMKVDYPHYFITLGVTLDKLESEKAIMGRLNLYYAVGFTMFKVKWDGNRDNLAYFSMRFRCEQN